MTLLLRSSSLPLFNSVLELGLLILIISEYITFILRDLASNIASSKQSDGLIVLFDKGTLFISG